MKGSVFNGFERYVLEMYGLDIWQAALEECHLESEGVYLASETYNDQELIALINALSQLMSINGHDVERSFGQFFFSTLFLIMEKHVEHVNSLFEFLRAVDDVIHVEVKKSDPKAYTPAFFYDQPEDNILVMRYVSNRKMCFFAEGLILGAAKHYQVDAKILQSKCTHCGDDYCLINIEI